MIAIGNAANNFYLGKVDKDPAHLEFLCWEDSEVEELIKEFKVGETLAKFTNNVSKTYLLTDKYLTIHNVAKMPFFKTISRSLITTANSRRIASPMLTYSWCKVKSSFLCDNIDNWEQDVLTCATLYKKYFSNLDSSMTFRLSTWKNSLIFFGAMGFGSSYEHYSFKPYTDYDENTLLDLFKHDDLGSIYKNTLLAISGGKFQLSKALFDRLPANKKLGLVMERLYTDCTNEFILDELLYRNVTELSTLALFKTTVMNRCSLSEFPWLTYYIIHNYPVIMKEFDPHFVDELFEAIRDRLIEPIR